MDPINNADMYFEGLDAQQEFREVWQQHSKVTVERSCVTDTDRQRDLPPLLHIENLGHPHLRASSIAKEYAVNNWIFFEGG